MSTCDTCLYYEYDEDYECYTCSMDLDEDEMYKFLTDTWKNCPYYRNNDEYEVVRHQMQIAMFCLDKKIDNVLIL